MPNEFRVKAGEFEGPLELLLDLIEKRKLHVSEVSLAKVADDFLEHIKQHEEFPMSDAADFILIASTLLLIKSKSLLPNLDLSEEEKISIEDLEDRLQTYRRYKELAQEISKLFGNFLYFANESRELRVVFSPAETTVQNIQDAMRRVFENMPEKEKSLPKLSVKKIMSLEEMIDRLSDRIGKSLRMSFKDFSGLGKAEKVDVIVSFLAMLELVKRGAVRVAQESHFDEIQMESENLKTPTY